MTTARARVEHALDALERSTLDTIWISVVEPAALRRRADEVDAQVAAGVALPLAGTVFAVKDNIDVADLPTTAAAPGFAQGPAERSATVVRRLTEAGAIVIGKTNMDQFATGLVGTRSPYGVVPSAVDPTRVAGGSSSGSAAAVAAGLVDFSLGTDTAGSGRVPAAFNGIVGVKPTRGLVSLDGVVPACRSYDTVTVFAPDLTAASLVLTHMIGGDAGDPTLRDWPDFHRLTAPPEPRLAIPRPDDLTAWTPAARAAFDRAVARAAELGATIHTVDLGPMLQAASLLYDGALVAERYEAFGTYFEQRVGDADPNVLAVVKQASAVTGDELVRDQGQVQVLAARAAEELAGCDALLLPTAPGHPTLAAVADDPDGVNRWLGTFTNFLNVLDMTGVAVPAEHTDDGLFGVTFASAAFDDQAVLDLAATFSGSPVGLITPEAIPIAVFGAHLSGQPLNTQLQDVGARLVGPAHTAPQYRLFALPGEPARPGLVRAEDDGVSIAGEEWLVTPAGLGRLMRLIGEPLALGPVRLDDDRRIVGFCSQIAQGTDISGFGGWLAYLASA